MLVVHTSVRMGTNSNDLDKDALAHAVRVYKSLRRIGSNLLSFHPTFIIFFHVYYKFGVG